MLDLVKMALRITSDAYDDQLNLLISAAEADLAVAGVDPVDEDDALVQLAVCTYCAFNFGDPDHADRFKKVYDEQKAQLASNTGHTDWLED